MNDILEKILSGALTIGLFCWVWIRSQARSDKMEERVLAIEQNGITREEFLREVNRWAQNRERMHEENQSALRDIRKDISDNEKRRSNTEHEILNVVNKLTVKQAAVEAVEHFKNTRDR